MRDKENGFSLFCKVFHNLHQLLNLLRREHRRGLIEDEYIIVPVKHL